MIILVRRRCKRKCASAYKLLSSFLSPVEGIYPPSLLIWKILFFCKDWILLTSFVPSLSLSPVAQLFQNLISSHLSFINGSIFSPVFLIPQIYLRKLFLNPWGYYHVTSSFYCCFFFLSQARNLITLYIPCLPSPPGFSISGTFLFSSKSNILKNP